MKNTSKNTVIISGNICADANVSASKNFAAFDLAHNAGKDNETLFDTVKIFSKNGNQTVDIPFDLLKKGARVLVKGFRRTEKKTYVAKDGSERTSKNTVIVATSIEAYPKDEENKSTNNVVISGNICADANVSASKNFAAFDLAHSAGKDNETLFDKVKMFSSNGRQSVEIPFDLLKKGARVLVKGFRRTETETYVAKDGSERTSKTTVIVALAVEAYPFEAEEDNTESAEKAA